MRRISFTPDAFFVCGVHKCAHSELVTPEIAFSFRCLRTQTAATVDNTKHTRYAIAIKQKRKASRHLNQLNQKYRKYQAARQAGKKTNL